MKNVTVGMSGGVDSAVAASILIEQGHQVEGLFMKNWEEDSEYCTSEEDYKDALQVCDTLNIPLRTVNFSKEYWDKVFKIFLSEYQCGRTPNPDILCNSEIKFKAFLNYALDAGANKIATGHYVRTVGTKNDMQLLKGQDSKKDQSYFLYRLNQKQLFNTLFPIGDISKDEVRDRAKTLGFKNFDKKDSVGICFIGQRNFKDFLQKYLPAQPGLIITSEGEEIGQHEGLMYYTIGQRKGLGIGGGKSGLESAWYVIDKNLGDNELIVGQGADNKKLYQKYLTASNTHWISGQKPKNMNLNAKIRYRAIDSPCKITSLIQDKVSVEFKDPLFAIAPGQSIVFYEDDVCLGGGVIDTSSN